MFSFCMSYIVALQTLEVNKDLSIPRYTEIEIISKTVVIVFKESTKEDCEVLSIDHLRKTIAIDYRYNGETPTVPTTISKHLNLIFHACQKIAQEPDQDRGFHLILQFDSRLLFISYKFVKDFLAISFLWIVFSSWNFHDVCQRFLYNQERNSSWIRQKMGNFPIEHHYKNHPLL